MRREAQLHSIAALTVMLAAGPGCRQFLGIEDASLDEDLAPVNELDSSSDDSGAKSPVPSQGGDAAPPPVGNPVDAGDAMSPAEAGSEPNSPLAPPEDGSKPPVLENDLCLEYCQEVQTNCEHEYEQYQELSVCLAVCKLLPEGKEGDRNKNTVQCRLRHASSARLEPFTYCKFAGPIGHEMCGNNCDAFCDMMMAVCTQDTAKKDRFESREDCLDQCMVLPDLGDFSTHASKGMYSGEHVQCRAFHATAATEEPDYHCLHAVGDFPCREEQ